MLVRLRDRRQDRRRGAERDLAAPLGLRARYVLRVILGMGRLLRLVGFGDETDEVGVGKARKHARVARADLRRHLRNLLELVFAGHWQRVELASPLDDA